MQNAADQRLGKQYLRSVVDTPRNAIGGVDVVLGDMRPGVKIVAIGAG